MWILTHIYCYLCVKQLNKAIIMSFNAKTYLWLHNIEKDFYKLVQILWETFTTTQRLKKPERQVTTSDRNVLSWDGWLIDIFVMQNKYLVVIYILRLYCFFSIYPHIFPTQQKKFSSYWWIFQLNPHCPSHPKDHVVNVCKHKFPCTFFGMHKCDTKETEPIL